MLGALVDLLLQGLEHLELRGGRDAVVATAATASPTAAPSPAAASLLGGLGLERVDELPEAARGGPRSVLGGLVGLEGLQAAGRLLHVARGALQGQGEDGGAFELLD